METFLKDLRYGARVLIKNPGFTCVVVLTLALGIGANTAIFSVMDGVLLRSLPVREPERLVLFEWEAGEKFRTTGMRGSFAPGPPGRRVASLFRRDVYDRLKAHQTGDANVPLANLFAFAWLGRQTVLLNNQAELANVQVVSGGYFTGLGVQPVLGRGLVEGDDSVSAPPAAVVSHAFWRERLGADPAVLGRQIRLNNQPFTVVGVTPPDFTGSTQVSEVPDVTVTLAFEPLLLGDLTAGTIAGKPKKPEFWWLHVMGRMKPGATTDQVRESLAGVFRAAALDVMPPPRRETDAAVLAPQDLPTLVAQSGSRGLMEVRKNYSLSIYCLFSVVGLVLLVACANVANLLLARSTARAHEISVRLAIGAGRWAVIRQLLAESLLLALVGGAVGVVLGYWGMHLLAAIAASGEADFLPAAVELTLNRRVLAFTFGVSLLTGVLFGLVPAWRTTNPDLIGWLKQNRRNTGTVSRLSKGLVVTQVALSLLVLVGAGLYIRTLYNLHKVQLGFNQENLLLFSLNPGQNRYEGERLTQFYQQLFTRLDALPGVRSATFGRIPLIAHYSWNTDFLLAGETEKDAGKHVANCQMIRANYFATMEIPVLAGRAFTETDDARAPKVAIVNQRFARQFFPNDTALGKHIRDVDGKRELEIVGIVGDTKYDSQRSEIEPLLFTSWRQESDETIGEMYFALRTDGDPTALAATVRKTVGEVDATLPVTEIQTQAARTEKSLGREMVFVQLLTFFGFLALLLAAIGLSGVLAYSVSQRTNEIGIRMALGAQPRRVLTLVIGQGMKLVGLGLGIGLLGGYTLLRLAAKKAENDWQRQLVDRLYGVTATDPVTFLAISLTLLAVALIACWWPARRAARVDPMVALRAE